MYIAVLRNVRRAVVNTAVDRLPISVNLFNVERVHFSAVKCSGVSTVSKVTYLVKTKKNMHTLRVYAVRFLSVEQ